MKGKELLDIKRWEVEDYSDIVWIIQAIIVQSNQQLQLGNRPIIIFEARGKDEKNQRGV